MDNLIAKLEEEIVAANKKKYEIEQERNEIIRQLELLRQAEAQQRAAMLARIVEDGVRLGMSISESGSERQWIDITESAIKLIIDLNKGMS